MPKYPGTVVSKTFPDTDTDTNLSVSLSEMKDHLRIDFDDADNELREFISSAQEYFQEYCNVSIVDRSLTYRVDSRHYPLNQKFTNGFWLPYPPINIIVGGKVVDSEGNETPLTNLVDYRLRDQHNGDKSVIIIDPKMDSEYEFEYTAGFQNTPKRMAQAIKLLVGTWYNNRENVISTGAIAKEIPRTFVSIAEMCKHTPGV